MRDTVLRINRRPDKLLLLAIIFFALVCIISVTISVFEVNGIKSPVMALAITFLLFLLSAFISVYNVVLKRGGNETKLEYVQVGIGLFGCGIAFIYAIISKLNIVE